MIEKIKIVRDSYYELLDLITMNVAASKKGESQPAVDKFSGGGIFFQENEGGYIIYISLLFSGRTRGVGQLSKGT